MTKPTLITSVSLLICLASSAKTYTVSSPDRNLSVDINTYKELTWSVRMDGIEVTAPSSISILTDKGEVLGKDPKVAKTERKTIDTSFETPLYRKDKVADRYNQLTLKMKGGYSLQVRAYDDAAAYRIILSRPDSVNIVSEKAEFRFGGDHKAWLPYINDLRDASYPYSFSFESYYDEVPLKNMPADTLSCTPLLIELDATRKALVMEGALYDYPGMFLQRSSDGNALQSVHAPLPLTDRAGGFNRLNLIPTSDAGHIARVAGDAALPWRAVAVSRNDAELVDNDIAMRLAEPNRIADTSWIIPGKVAWDWWNDWGLTGVDFEAGINTDTYKHYIDFAARKGLQYVILDEGWAKDNGNLLDINPDVDLKSIISYAKERGIGIILWATWQQLRNDYKTLLPYFAEMGVKGFKVDFFDRDDQAVISSIADIAEEAADLHLMLDLHGFRPIGLQRTFPNIVNYEGVKGLENYKWGAFREGDPDQLRYDATIPFVRMVAGPLDYTPGAMTNSTAASYRPSNDAPMSLGTRAHQVAMYVVYDGALQMLADSPSAYDREPDCADFMAAIPTVFDETRVISGKVGEYVVIARRAGDTWYVGALTGSNSRQIPIDLSFLPQGVGYNATILSDGVNAAKHPIDYRITNLNSDSATRLDAVLAPGGGWTAILRPVK